MMKKSERSEMKGGDVCRLLRLVRRVVRFVAADQDVLYFQLRHNMDVVCSSDSVYHKHYFTKF